jgi:ribosomal protein S18 acetylase RimI-like enzyme
MRLEVFPLAERHINKAVEIHIRAFPGFFLSLLGRKFLRVFYAGFLNERSSIAFVAKEKGKDTKLLGVVVGTQDPNRFFRRLLIKRWWAFCFTSVCPLLKKPAIGFRLFRAILYRGDLPKGRSGALLSSIAVIPEAQGQGVGGILINKWLDEARKRGVFCCFLTTDAEHNDEVNLFYSGSGWKIDSVFRTPEGRKMNRYIFVIKGRSE